MAGQAQNDGAARCGAARDPTCSLLAGRSLSRDRACSSKYLMVKFRFMPAMHICAGNLGQASEQTSACPRQRAHVLERSSASVYCISVPTLNSRKVCTRRQGSLDLWGCWGSMLLFSWQAPASTIRMRGALSPKPDLCTCGACRLLPSILEDKWACAAPLFDTPESSSADGLHNYGTRLCLPSFGSLESLLPSAGPADAAPRPTSSSTSSCCASSQPATPRVSADSPAGSPKTPAPCQSTACGVQRGRPRAGKEWLLPWAEAGFGDCGRSRSGSDEDDADSAAVSKRRRTGGVQVWPEPSMQLCRA